MVYELKPRKLYETAAHLYYTNNCELNLIEDTSDTICITDDVDDFIWELHHVSLNVTGSKQKNSPIKELYLGH